LREFSLALSFYPNNGIILKIDSQAPRRKRKMIICEFSLQFQNDGRRRFGLERFERMSCREFDTRVERFYSNPSDFTGPRQIIQMAISICIL
jgi:hypothetical protein